MNAIFFDIDETLTTTLSGEPFKQNPTDIQLMEGVEKGLNHFVAKGYKLFGVSNQGGVAAGHKSINSAIEEMQNTHRLIPQLEMICFCPDYEGNLIYEIEQWEHRSFQRNLLFHPNAQPKTTLLFSPFRKPESGMISKIIWDWNLHDADELWMIGDRPEDEQCAIAAGVNFLWADAFRKRFSPGMHEISNLTTEQLRFLEGIQL